MYLTFYGLREKPFGTTPDPRFLYLTPGHREALAQLTYGVREGQGFLVLTGEVGTGKTTLLQALLQRLDGNTDVAFVFNSTLPFEGLLEYILEDLGINKAGESLAQKMFALNNFLIERRRAGQKTVVIIDEAQNLDLSTLEQIRLLSNFETPTEKLLQILLVGQPELKAKLDRPELRQLKQRIGLRCRVSPLALDEVLTYIKKRLRVAGARDVDLFTRRAIKRIAAYSAGVPRLVNLVCDNALLIGYADQERVIDRRTVDQAIDYLEERGERGAWLPRWIPRIGRWGARRWIAVAFGVVLVAGTGAVSMTSALGPVMVDIGAHVVSAARAARDVVFTR